jgi:oxygen-independent coproporphyrinogen-3 oxidase
MAGGQKYHAHFVPDDDMTADFYEVACERLNAAGIEQYEISNFARTEYESRHNLKYWTRQPYFGFGVDAHSMLAAAGKGAVRFLNPDGLEKYIAAGAREHTIISPEVALQETFFLGLRMNRGVRLDDAARVFGEDAVAGFAATISESIGDGLLQREGKVVRLTARGRLLSNEVFEKFISPHPSLAGAVLAPLLDLAMSSRDRSLKADGRGTLRLLEVRVPQRN